MNLDELSTSSNIFTYGWILAFLFDYTYLVNGDVNNRNDIKDSRSS